MRGAAVAERHRENAGRGRRGEETGSTVADSHQEDAARREMRSGEEPSGRRCTQGAAPRSSIGQQHREATPPRKAAGKGAAAGFDF
ncbi:MAG: hypothetical protein SPH62_07120 [Candidatus Egerieousia sp.]|nr:hypothetical protein [bacterium]MDY5256154.1 hypothetical protein [Candidatus Egerieousia sp.]